jgi:methylase of polypeptide subunit release factors
MQEKINTELLNSENFNWPQRILETYEKTHKLGESGKREINTDIEVIKKFVVYPGVFAPDVFRNSTYFATLSWEVINELRQEGFDITSFAEMGCGSGLTSVYLALIDQKLSKIVAIDVNPNAVENTQENASLNNVSDRLEVIHSDCFLNVPKDLQLDLVAWWIPYNPVRAPASEVDEMLLKGGFDPQYKSLNDFFDQVDEYLSENGSILLGVGDNVVNNTLISQIISSRGWNVKTLKKFIIPLEVGTTEPLIKNKIIHLTRKQ